MAQDLDQLQLNPNMTKLEPTCASREIDPGDGEESRHLMQIIRPNSGLICKGLQRYVAQYAN